MEATDIIRFFLHDKIAAKKWKRYAEREHYGIITYQYVSTNSDEYGFDIVLHEIHGNMWFSIWSPTSAITLFKEDIRELRSHDYNLWIEFGGHSFILLAYGPYRGDEL